MERSRQHWKRGAPDEERVRMPKTARYSEGMYVLNTVVL